MEARNLIEHLGKHHNLSFYRSLGYIVTKHEDKHKLEKVIIKKKETSKDEIIKENVIICVGDKFDFAKAIINDGFNVSELLKESEPDGDITDPKKQNYKYSHNYSSELSLNY